MNLHNMEIISILSFRNNAVITLSPDCSNNHEETRLIENVYELSDLARKMQSSDGVFFRGNLIIKLYSLFGIFNICFNSV